MKLLIVGGVAGGASAAARSRRLSEDAEIVLFERGPDVSFANCGLPYYIGDEIAERKKLLVTTPEMVSVRGKALLHSVVSSGFSFQETSTCPDRSATRSGNKLGVDTSNSNVPAA